MRFLFCADKCSLGEEEAAMLNGLLVSRKFWLAVFGIIQAVVLHYLNVPEEIWQAISALVAVLIASIAIEDAAEKRAGMPEAFYSDEEDLPEM